ncbi:MAG: UDP-N-acetylmuramate dehydrogenase [Clostridia bacterium]|nr:UDP-N-acetylmuramate dehydrogenase [Clostridia bacterium]
MQILEKLKQITDEKNIFVDELMSKHTSFKTGGKAEYFVTPESKEELIEILKIDSPITIIGNGSNLLVKDNGIKGIVVSTIKLRNYKIDGDTIEADAGMPLIMLSKIAAENGLTGLEFACGIPGTLGGAIFMNAGAYGGEMNDIVVSSEYIDKELNIREITEHKFEYRRSIYSKEIDGIILSAKLKLQQGDIDQIKEKMNQNIESRNSKQPINMPSAGSTFKRKDGVIVSKLIDEAGLKGYTIGGAQVSTLHAGFIVNKGDATSQDIIDLIQYVQQVIKDKYEIDIETEIKIIGE